MSAIDADIDRLAGPDTPTAVEMYRVMATIRAVEEKFRALLMSGQVAATCHAPWGQEAISAGVSAHLRQQDYVVTTYRGMHDQIAKGVPVNELMAEYFGKATGLCKGKGGPMHVSYPACGLMVTTGIVGSGIPIANGFAVASRLRRSDQVTVCNFGDGSTNIGAFHEALTLASLWKLPVIFVCQNNGIAEHTLVADHLPVDTVAQRAAAYDIPPIIVDGTDPDAVWGVAGEAVARARRGDGPTLIEATCLRQAGHNIGDSATFLPAGWMDKALAYDPVRGYRDRLVANGAITDADAHALETDIEEAVDAAVRFATESPYPDAGEIHRDVYAEESIA